MNQYRLAYTYNLFGMPGQAVEVLNEILQVNPNESPPHYALGIYCEKMGEHELAPEQYLKFRPMAEHWENEYPVMPSTCILLGVILTRLGEKKAGWEAGKKAIEMDIATLAG